jgi:hypothetical protein
MDEVKHVNRPYPPSNDSLVDGTTLSTTNGIPNPAGYRTPGHWGYLKYKNFTK